MFKVLYFISWFVLIVDSFFLILLILAQESKASGLGGLGGGMDMTFAGHTQRTAKRLTSIGAIVFAVCIIAVILLMKPAGKGSTGSMPSVASPSPTVTISTSAEPGAGPGAGTPER